jgi:hypothetical protein
MATERSTRARGPAKPKRTAQLSEDVRESAPRARSAAVRPRAGDGVATGALPVLDAQGRARICGAPATTTREVDGGLGAVELPACEACAAAVDAQGGHYEARREGPATAGCAP